MKRSDPIPDICRAADRFFRLPVSRQVGGWRRLFPIAVPVALFFLAGCAVGPDYKPPTTAVSAAFAHPVAGAVSTEGAPRAQWWVGFQDPVLDRLITRAVESNHDLRLATANLKESRALRRLSAFDLAPTIQASGSYQRSLASTARALPGASRAAREDDLFDTGFDAGWELDFFGRVRRSVEAADADLGVAEATREDVQVIVVAEVARNYFELRGAQRQLAVAHQNAEVQAQTLKITEARLEGGRGTDFDVARSASLLNQTLASIPPLEASIQRAIHRAAVLTGQQPTALLAELSVASPLPVILPALYLGEPAALLRHRPDVRAAERALAAATARFGVATADYFPRVTFSGRIGLQAGTVSGLGRSGAESFSLGPSISWAALDLGRVRARLKAADARAEAALIRYERTVVEALEETENALVAYNQEQAQRAYLQAAAEASQRATDLAHQRYEGGKADFLSVLDSERSLLAAQDQLAVSQTQAVIAFIAIQKALGGGGAENQASPN